MKKLLILIVAIALFLHFYPQPELESWYGEQKSDILSKFSDATDTKARLKAGKIFTDLESQFERFNQDEQIFLKEITQDRKSVTAFYQEHCIKKKQSPKFHNENQVIVCNKIKQFSALM